MLIGLLCLIIIFLVVLIAIDEREIKKLKYREQTHLDSINKLTRKLMRRKQGRV